MKMIKIDSYRKLGLVCALVFVLAVSIFASINVFAQSTRLTVTPDNIVLMDDLDNITKTSSLPWDNITDTAPIGPYSFMISTFTNATATYYQATNGTDGKIIDSWTSTDVTIVWRSLADIIPDGSSIYIAKGDYPITSYNATYSGGIGLNGKNNIRVFGDGYGTNIYSYNTTNPTLGVTFEPMIEIQDCNGIVFENMRFTPNSTTATGDALDFDHSSGCAVRNCNFSVPLGSDGCISFHADTENIAGNMITGNTFVAQAIPVKVFNTGSYTIYGTIISGNSFTPPAATHGSTAISLSGKVYDTVISSNVIGGVTKQFTTQDILLTDCRQTMITGNRFCGYGIGITISASYRTTISGNDFTGCSTAVSGYGSTDVAVNQVGFTVDSWKSGANTTATTYVYAHGLSSTCRGAIASFNDTGITGYTVAFTNATHNTITIAGTPTSTSWVTTANSVYRP